MTEIFSKNDKGLVLGVKITPNASSAGVKGIFTDADGRNYVKISVVSIPEKGKANKELLKFLSKELGVAKSELEIVSGETTHLKRILIKQDNADVVAKLDEWSRE